jgi:signal transduction histidine kinase
MWIRRELAVYFNLAVATVIFTAVFYGYSLPMTPLLYAAGLTLFVFFAITLARHMIWRKKVRQLEELCKIILVNPVALPAASDGPECVYQQMIALLRRRLTEIDYEKDRDLTEMVDYYTVWAHQIKTPIAALRLLLQTDKVPQYAEIGEQLSRIEEYVDMVLGFIRSEAISGDLLLKKYDLDGIVKQAVKRHSKTFIRKKIALKYDPLNTCAVTDKKWLTFVLEQVLSNALKYTNQGHVAIYMDHEKTNTLVVEDTGVGIHTTDLPRVFEKGYTGYRGREHQPATGVGLYLCKKVLDKLSHHIEIESEEGRGTRVKISFPSQEGMWE